MRKLVVPFFLFCQFAFVRAQEEAFAVINDKDGYVNVRKEKNARSKVLKKLNNKTIVFVYNYDKATDGNWISIPMKKGIFIMIESSGYINSL